MSCSRGQQSSTCSPLGVSDAYYSTELNRPHRQRRCSERLRVQTREPGGHLIRAAAGAATTTLPLFLSLLNLSTISSFCCNMRHLLRGSRRFKGMFFFLFFFIWIPASITPAPPTPSCFWPSFLWKELTSDKDQIASRWCGRKSKKLNEWGGICGGGLVGGGRCFTGSEGSEMRSRLWGLLLLQPVLAVRGPGWPLTSLPAAWGSG